MMNVIFVIKYTKVSPKFTTVFLKPLLAALTCAVAASLVYKVSYSFIGLTLSTMISIIAAALVYLLAIFVFGVICESDIKLIPKGEKIASLLKRFHLLKG